MSEIGNLQRQRNAYYRQKEECQFQRREINAKLERLRQAKRQVGDIKGDIREYRKWISRRPDEYKGSWVGDEFRWLVSMTGDQLVPDWKQYYYDADTVLDEICDEITRLENENRHLGVVLNSIVNSINSISNEIEKLLN